MTYKPGQESLEDVDALIITFGLIFNDLKGLAWWGTQLDKYPPKNLKNPSEYLGQWSGMKIQTARLSLGLLAELLNTIIKNEKVLNHPLFIRTIKTLKSSAQKSWKDLLAAARNNNSRIIKNKKIFSLIQEVRSNGVFHYENINEIHRGYKAHFQEQVPITSHEFATDAFLSLGITMLQTRFYFSDAAIDGYSKIKAKNFQAEYGEQNISLLVADLLDDINNSLRFIIDVYIKFRKNI